LEELWSCFATCHFATLGEIGWQGDPGILYVSGMAGQNRAKLEECTRNAALHLKMPKIWHKDTLVPARKSNVKEDPGREEIDAFVTCVTQPQEIGCVAVKSWKKPTPSGQSVDDVLIVPRASQPLS
jgi:hypothetical protein